jgi:coenzyme PQQ synthesis protein D (PqqD)
MLTLDSCVAHQMNTHGSVLGKEAVVVLPEQGEIKVLNEVGARMWELIDGQRALRDIAAIIAAEYAVTLEIAQADTIEFVTEMIGKGILQEVSSLS